MGVPFCRDLLWYVRPSILKSFGFHSIDVPLLAPPGSTKESTHPPFLLNSKGDDGGIGIGPPRRCVFARAPCALDAGRPLGPSHMIVLQWPWWFWYFWHSLNMSYHMMIQRHNDIYPPKIDEHWWRWWWWLSGCMIMTIIITTTSLPALMIIMIVIICIYIYMCVCLYYWHLLTYFIIIMIFLNHTHTYTYIPSGKHSYWKWPFIDGYTY